MSDEAFTMFDLDADGFITEDEMIEILTNGSDMSEPDARSYFETFDKDEDKKLSKGEFEDAWQMFASFLSIAVGKYNFKQVEKTTESYTATVKPYIDKVAEMFAKLDEDRDGVLSIAELKEVLMIVQGTDFDEAAFFRWHDVHSRERHFGTGGSVDKQEFGWYIADCAECQAGKMDLVVNEFVEATDYVHNKKKQAKVEAAGPKRQYAYVPKKKSFLRMPTFKSSKSTKNTTELAVSGDTPIKKVVANEQALADALLATLGDPEKAETLVFGTLIKVREAKAKAATPLAPSPAAAAVNDKLADMLKDANALLEPVSV